MPIYEYLCESCGRVSEVMQKVSDPAPSSCPACGGGKIAKLVSRSAFRLKGGGWYADLYGSSKKGKDDGAAAKPERPTAEAPPPKPSPSPEGSTPTSPPKAKAES